MSDKLDELKTRLGEIDDLNTAAAVLRWDQRTCMPSAGAAGRAAQLGTLAALAHKRVVADEIGQLLDALDVEFRGADYDSFEASLLRVTRRRYERERKLPTQLVAALSQVTALAQGAWEQARAGSDFAHFQPHLARVLELTLEKAAALGFEEHPYDALFDLYEPGMKTAQVASLFGEMKAGLVPLVQAIARQPDAVDDSLFGQEFDVERQWDLSLEVIQRIGFDMERGRLDRSAHPITTSFSIDDVRLTTRVYPDQFKAALFASIHESGHGIYAQGHDPAFARTPLSGGASSGVHESQSRLLENVVGRSKGFWTFWLPRLKDYFAGQLEGVGVEDFYRAINRVNPTFIRVEADEVTYNLHIMLRFEIETQLLEGKVPISDLPELWDSKMVEYLGIRPPNDTLGVLQDVHWAIGLVGYFPTYSLGNLLACQLYNQALAEEPSIPAQIEAGEFRSLIDWMRRNVHLQGTKYMPAELIERITGGPIRTEPFLDYIREKYTGIYNL